MASTGKNTQLFRNDGYADAVDLMKTTGYKALWLLMGMGFVAACIWIFPTWRTHRELNGYRQVGVRP
jgi:hypothetical protein